jgi:hypothetical protein
LGRIDVIETDINCLIYLTGTNIFGDFPRSKANLGDLSAVVQGNFVEGHRDRVSVRVMKGLTKL